VIHTYSGYEKKVKTNLEHRIESMGMEDKIFQVLVPEEDEIEIRSGQRVTVQKKVYPGYCWSRCPRPGLVVRRPQHAWRDELRRRRQHPGSRNEPVPSRSTRSSRSCARWRRDAQVPRGLPEGPERARHRRAFAEFIARSTRSTRNATRSRSSSASSAGRHPSNSTSYR